MQAIFTKTLKKNRLHYYKVFNKKVNRYCTESLCRHKLL